MKTDAMDRRLRWARPNPEHRPKRAPKRIELTEADYQLFEVIDRHGLLPSNYLHELTRDVRKAKGHLQNRLTEFYNGDENGAFLRRPRGQFDALDWRRAPVVYDLAPRAKAALEATGRAAKFPAKRTNDFVHDLMMACVGASFELAAREKGLRYISREEILTGERCKADSVNPLAIPLPAIPDQGSLIPDDLFGLEGEDEKGKWYRFFAVEADRNSESIRTKSGAHAKFGRKIAAYLTILRSGSFRTWWGIPNLAVLIITTNYAHASNLQAEVKTQANDNKGERFAFQVEPCFGSRVSLDFDGHWRVPKEILTKLLNEPWQTVNGSKDISKP